MKYLLILALFFAVNAEAVIKRSNSARVAFAKSTACPSTGLKKLPCPGYVIDHTIALACGGLDNKNNMQWQTIAEAKAKDRWERKGCTK